MFVRSLVHRGRVYALAHDDYVWVLASDVTGAGEPTLIKLAYIGNPMPAGCEEHWMGANWLSVAQREGIR